MIPIKQSNLHKPQEGIWGDCHRAVIASLLEIPLSDVPHFGDGGPDAEEFNRRVRELLESKGLVQFDTIFDCSLGVLHRYMLKMNPGIYYILGGRSRTGVNHSVIGLNDTIAHDPSLNNSGIVGPCDDGFYWVTVLVPIFFFRA